MKVIFAGYSKTGTKTMAEAFRVLGYNVYDALENHHYLYREWNKVFWEGATPDDFRRMYKGVDAVTDVPCFLFWEQLHEAFPDAKIILTIRDEDSWYKSFIDQIRILNSSYFAWFADGFIYSGFMRMTYRRNSMSFFGKTSRWPRNKEIPYSEMVLKRMYREHNNYVQMKAPKDKLLIFEISDGWDPLCKFLGVPVPDQPFPHKNKGGKVLDEMKNNPLMIRYSREILATLSVYLIIGAYGCYKVVKMWPRAQEAAINTVQFLKGLLK